MRRLLCLLIGHTNTYTCERCGTYRHILVSHDGQMSYDPKWLIQQDEFKEHIELLKKLAGE